MQRMFIYSRFDRFILDRKKQVMRQIGVRANWVSFADLKKGLRAYSNRGEDFGQWSMGYDAGNFHIGCKQFAPNVAMKIALFLLDKPRKKK